MARSALIIVDVQNDFCPGGALAIPEGDEVVAFINELIYEHKGHTLDFVFATRDWHPEDNSYDWPPHCIQGTPGASYHSDLDVALIDYEFRKGTQPDVHPYGGFFKDNDQRDVAELHYHLADLAVRKVYVVGLATDYCVKKTAIDAVALGYDVTVLIGGCRGLDPKTTGEALTEMLEAGVSIRKTL